MYVAAEWFCSMCALAEDKYWRGSSFMKPAWTKTILPELELNISYKPVKFTVQVCCIGTQSFLRRWQYFLHAFLTMLHLPLIVIFKTADVKRNYSHLQMLKNNEILLHRFRHEIINRAKNSTKASWGSRLFYVNVQVFLWDSPFWGKCIVLYLSSLETGVSGGETYEH